MFVFVVELFQKDCVRMASKKKNKAPKQETSVELETEELLENSESSVEETKSKAPLEEKEEKNSASLKESKNEHPVSLKEEKGTLMLRQFIRDDRTRKIITRLKKKVFFPADPNLEPGWYVATIVDAKATYGVMDTIALEDVPQHLWHHRHIKGIYVERNHKEHQLEIYPAIPKELLEEQRPVCIHRVPLPEPKYQKGATIGEIIASKQKEAISSK